MAQAHAERDPFPIYSDKWRGLRSNQVGVRGRVLEAPSAPGTRSLQCAGLAARWQRHGHEAGWDGAPRRAFAAASGCDGRGLVVENEEPPRELS